MERWPCDFCDTKHVARSLWGCSPEPTTWCRTLGLLVYSPDALMFRPARAHVERRRTEASIPIRRVRVERSP